jgi:ribulose-phosphate 3-epimerase
MRIAPSILSADFTRLGEQVRAVADAGAHSIHVDVMDGRFVPNITVGPLVVEAVRRSTTLPIDVHLMIERAERYVGAFIDAGADSISVHVEAQPHLARTLHEVHTRQKRAGVAINPGTPLAALDEVLPDLEYVLLMTVNPGFGGQMMLPRSLDRVRALRHAIQSRGLRAEIEIDGGVTLDNAAAVRDAGVDVIVVGSTVFGEPDPAAQVGALLSRIAS